jgi:hypothetical protein
MFCPLVHDIRLGVETTCIKFAEALGLVGDYNKHTDEIRKPILNIKRQSHEYEENN